MPHKVSQQHTYPPRPSPAPSPERQEHSYPPSRPSPALHAESSPTASAASSALTSPFPSPSSTPSPPPTPRRNPRRTSSLTGGLGSTPQRGPSMLKTVTRRIEKHRLPRPKGAGRMNIETLVNWDKGTLDAIKVRASLCSSHPILTCKSGRSKEAHVDYASA